MSTKTKIFIPCDEANHFCDKTQYKEATLWEKIKLSIHLIYCQACRKYTKNNTKLTKMINGSIDTIKGAKIECLDNEHKESMKKDFEEALKRHSS